jgi:choline dehydrogenase
VNHDVIIIGAGAGAGAGSGAGGAVLARRLIDGSSARVLLLEAGGEAENPAIQDPTRINELRGGPEDWGYTTVPQPGAAGRRLSIPRGRVLGGSTSINGMIYVRGWRGDFDHWAYLGNDGSAYQDVLPLFKRLEDFDGGPSVFHGSGGALRVRSRYEPHPVAAALIEAAVQYGIPYNPDPNGEQLDGVSLAQLTMRDGRRLSAMDAFIAPIRDSPRLKILTGTRARRLVFEGDRCVGVEARRNGIDTVFTARPRWSSAPGRSNRRGSCCPPESVELVSWRESAWTCPGSARTSTTTSSCR